MKTPPKMEERMNKIMEMAEQSSKVHEYMKQPATREEVLAFIQQELDDTTRKDINALTTILMVLSEAVLDKGLISPEDIDNTKKKLVKSGKLVKENKAASTPVEPSPLPVDPDTPMADLVVSEVAKEKKL